VGKTAVGMSEMLLDFGTLTILKLESSSLWISKRGGLFWPSPDYNFSPTHYSWQRATFHV